MPVFSKVRVPSRLASKVLAKYKHVQTKILKRHDKRFYKTERFVFENYRQTSQRNMNVRKDQLKNIKFQRK